MRNLMKCSLLFIILYTLLQNPFKTFSERVNLLPSTSMNISLNDTALVITDPQNDFLSTTGVAWNLVENSVIQNNTIEHLDLLLQKANERQMLTVISPHYYYPFDQKWKFRGRVEQLMKETGMYKRKGPLTLIDFEGSGADFLEQFKPYLENGNTIITNPHKVYGPESNDLVLQLRKYGIQKVILAGMSANLCVESHMRELLEQGFEVAVVYDATAAAQLPNMDGYKAALTNFEMLANETWSTEETLKRMDMLVQ